MTEKEIANLLYDELSYVYCDNCRGSDLENVDDIEEQCEYCHRKSQNWGIRRSTADRLVSIIVSK
jgi:hypothetical protein